MSRFFSDKYKELNCITPREVLHQKKMIKLDTNESPYPASQFVYRSMDQFEVDNLRLYSDPEATKLVTAIAENFGIDTNKVTVGNGSDELLAFAFMAFQNQDRKFYFPEISYGYYSAYAEVAKAKKVQIPMRDGLRIDPKDFFNLDGTIVIANPNTPTGLALTQAEIEEILIYNKDNLVVMDEAYIDFGGESCMPLVDKYDNLLIIQTFSKSRNLAGARIGFAIGNPEIIADLNKMKFSFNRHNLNRLSIIAGTAAIRDKDYFKKCTNDIKRTRDRFKTELERLGFECLESCANFLFVKPPELSGEAYFQGLMDKNILVKHYSAEELKDYVRITIGLPDAMDLVIKATKSILGIEEPIGE